MPYRVDIYKLAREEYALDEDGARQIEESEYRLGGNLCMITEVPASELPEGFGEEK